MATTSTKVPFGQKMAFGSGHLVLNLLPGALAVFMFFLVTAFGMDPWLAGLLGGLPRIFDALTDPIMGFISDNTKSKWGRRRPYIFVGALMSGILFAFLFQLSENNSVIFNFWYFLLMSLLFLVGNTMFATPLVGLGYEMTTDYNERTRLMAFANTIAQIAWMLVPWFWVMIADPTVFPISEEALRKIGEMGLSGDALTKITTETLQGTGVRNLSLMVGLACAVLGILPALFCKGIDAGDMENRKKIALKTLSSSLIDLWQSIKEVFKNKPFMKLCGATFLVFNGFQMVASFSFFIIVFYIFNGDYGLASTWPAWFASLTALITAFMVIPIISRIANKWGKRQAFIISTVISIFGYGLKWFGFDNSFNAQFNQSTAGIGLNNFVVSVFDTINPFLDAIGMSWFSMDTSQGGPWLMFVPIPFMAFGLGGLFTLMMSMTADVCDLDELTNGLPRKEGTFGAIYWWFVKLGQAIALVLGGAVLSMVGFDEGAVTQTAITMNRLRIADISIPAVTAAIAIWIMWKYDLNETRLGEIKAELLKRKNVSKINYYHGQKLNLFSRENLNIDNSTDIDFSNKSNLELHSIFNDRLSNKMHGICFSPYEPSQKLGDKITEEQIRRRMDIIAPYTTWVRSFSCTDGNELIPKIAKEKGLKTLVGVWISNDKEQSEKEIMNLIKLANESYIDMIAVGNEVLMRNELSEQEVIAYIQKVKKAIPNIPVGYADAYYKFIQSPNLVSACDVILANCYPFWEGSNNDEAVPYLRKMYALTQKIANGKKVIISETGWPNKGAKVEGANPTDDNALKYFVNTIRWSAKKDVDLFYFSSFDESWKVGQEGDVGERWGIWDKKEQLKY